MKLENCHGCKWFYIRTIKGYTEYMCSYVRKSSNRHEMGAFDKHQEKKDL